jgi:deazaflavin-dependent oxidoreductase (nitroreductase family)
MARPDPGDVTPYDQAGWLQKLTRWTTPTRPFTWLYLRIQSPVDRLIHRLTGGRTTASQLLSGLPVVMLTTTGARTGLPRTHPMLGFREGQVIIVLASNYGRQHHPAWYHNLKAHRRAAVTVGGITRVVEARELTGDERTRWLERAAALYPGFLVYQARSPHRPIPVIRLEPAHGGSGAGGPAPSPEPAGGHQP